MRILFYCWKAYNQSDIIAALRRRGHDVDTFAMELGNFEVDDNFTEKFIEKMSSSGAEKYCQNDAADEQRLYNGSIYKQVKTVYDAVFSVNYFPIISDICEQLFDSSVKYICWTCDSPLSTMYHESIFNKCNYIFIFDRFCYMEFKERGANVYYLPLAAAIFRADEVISKWQKNRDENKNETDDKIAEVAFEACDSETGSDKDEYMSCGEEIPGMDSKTGGDKAGYMSCGEEIPERDDREYLYDVSFIGSMYRKNSYDEIKDMLPDYVRGYFDALMKMQMEIYGENYIDGMLTAEIIDELNKHFRIEKSERSFSDISLIFSTTVLGFKIAQLERYKLLGALSKRFDVNVFTDDENADFVLAHNMGPVRYWDESPVVFYESKINLNFTIRNIRSGIPLRVWDILAAGGFCITNFQPELVLYFKNGEDIVWFEDEDDLVQKVRYYLRHEEERKKIALNGQKKVRQLHNYDVRLQVIEDAISM